MKEDKVLIKRYKGIGIYFNLRDSTLTAENKKIGEKYSGKYIFEIEREIENPIWEEHRTKAFIIDGTFSTEIYVLIANKRDIKSKEHSWVKGESTDNNFDGGKELDFFDRDKTIYPYTKYNIDIFNKVKSKQGEVNEKEMELRELVSQLEKRLK